MLVVLCPPLWHYYVLNYVVQSVQFVLCSNVGFTLEQLVVSDLRRTAHAVLVSSICTTTDLFKAIDMRFLLCLLM